VTHKEERPPGYERPGRTGENESKLVRRSLKVEDEDEVVGVTLGLVLEEVGADEVDVEPGKGRPLPSLGDSRLRGANAEL